ncbi:MAG: SBBP repeat-containing protein, partial [Terriglobales bacterium]
EAVLSLQRAASGAKEPATTSSGAARSAASVIRMRLDGANRPASIHGTELLPGQSNYFIGNDPSKWKRGIPQFAGVEYQGVYPGIDLVYYGKQRQLEYDFRVAAGADPSQIALSFKGASAHLDSGDLVLSTVGGDVRFQAPHIYQRGGNTAGHNAAGQNPAGQNDEQAIAGSFRLLADNKVGFAVGPYDHSRELVIDPILTYSTYLGEGTESLVNVAVDASDNIYVAGSTQSAGFPVTAGALQNSLAGPQNIFIATINTSASGLAQLLFATYLGGNGTDQLAGIAVDPGPGSSFPNINMYVAGRPPISRPLPATPSNQRRHSRELRVRRTGF